MQKDRIEIELGRRGGKLEASARALMAQCASLGHPITFPTARAAVSGAVALGRAVITTMEGISDFPCLPD